MSRVLCVLLAVFGCSQSNFDPPSEVIIARFDPEAGVIPMPSDILRDEALGRLDLPLEDAESEAERGLFEFLNTLDGWSSAMSATVEFTGPINPATVTGETLEVWSMGSTPRRVSDVTVSLDDTETTLTIDPPRSGWELNSRYAVLVRGGVAGLEGKRGELVEADAAFYFLRLTEALDRPEHERAFPGQTAAERQQNARDLEEVRLELAPDFEFFEARGTPRNEIAAMFSFTVTDRVELAMDKASQRMPLPFNLLRDPSTGLVDLPAAAWDSDVEREAKEKLSQLDGFGTSAGMLMTFTAPIDPATATAESIQLFDHSGATPIGPLEASIQVLEDNMHIEVTPVVRPLRENARYAVAVTDDLKDPSGRSVIPMPLGQLLKLEAPIASGGASTIDSINTTDAEKVEAVRSELSDFWPALPRERVVAAWTFTTMSVAEPMSQTMSAAHAVATSPHPKNVERLSPIQALLDFPLAIASLFFVDDVYHGTLETPDYIDPVTRANRADGTAVVREIPFTLTLPDTEPGQTVPVVIFGHGVMTERRFVLAIGDALAARGFAAIAIDLPFHGERTHCFAEGPLSIPNPQTGELTPLGNPCADGGECQPGGHCNAADGSAGELAKWPIIGMYQSSGAAFLEIEKIANTRDHFQQALIDLSMLRRSLADGDWLGSVGVHFDENNIHYAGQSLGGIVGATFLSLHPSIKRAVLNVPGADTVNLFRDSPFFGGQIEAFFTREDVDPQSYDGHRFLNVGRWLMDAVDPHSFARGLIGRDIMLQMATLDFIIPNAYTERLEALTGLPRRDYIGEHAFLVIPIEPAYLRGVNELAEYLQGDFTPRSPLGARERPTP